MKKEQRIVAVGAACGLTFMLVSVATLSNFLPHLSSGADAGSRLAFAAKWIAFAALPLVAAIGAVGNERFFSEAIDPTAHKESRKTIIDGRVGDNTVQQYLLFSVATLAVAAASRGDQIATVSAAAITYVVCRAAFWVGYRIDPLYRAFGFASTFYLNLLLFGVAAWRAWH